MPKYKHNMPMQFIIQHDPTQHLNSRHFHPGSNKFSRVLRSTFTQVPWIRSCKMLKDHLSCWESLGIPGNLEPNMGSNESPAGDLMTTELIVRSIAASQSFEQHWEEYDQPLTQATKNDQHADSERTIMGT